MFLIEESTFGIRNDAGHGLVGDADVFVSFPQRFPAGDGDLKSNIMHVGYADQRRIDQFEHG